MCICLCICLDVFGKLIHPYVCMSWIWIVTLIAHLFHIFQTYICMYIYIFIHIYLSNYVSIYPSVYLFFYLPIFFHVPIFLFIYLYIYLLSIYLSIFLSIYLSIQLSIYLSIYPSNYLSMYINKEINVYIYIYWKYLCMTVLWYTNNKCSKCIYYQIYIIVIIIVNIVIIITIIITMIMIKTIIIYIYLYVYLSIQIVQTSLQYSIYKAWKKGFLTSRCSIFPLDSWGGFIWLTWRIANHILCISLPLNTLYLFPTKNAIGHAGDTKSDVYFFQWRAWLLEETKSLLMLKYHSKQQPH